jgi:hypothetical protein
LDALPDSQTAKFKNDELSTAHKSYAEALSNLVAEIRKWRGNDPIAVIYQRVFIGNMRELGMHS